MNTPNVSAAAERTAVSRVPRRTRPAGNHQTPGWLKPAVFAACLLPFVLLTWRTLAGDLGPNPVETITHDTGDWALRMLLLTLAMTPLRKLLGWAWPVRVRRMVGLFAFFYAALHFATYLWLDQFFDLSAVLADVTDRPYITVGFAALLLMLPLALTSTRGWQRRLGSAWKRLHRLVYAIGVLGVLHYLWLVKADLLEPAIYAAVLTLLLAARIPWRRIHSGALGGFPRVGRDTAGRAQRQRSAA
jgi:sulfoxide reductase heme-binding subunit YedZ